jgi:hypothetical protein
MLTDEKTQDMTAEAILLAQIEEYSRLPHKKAEHYWQLRHKREDTPLTDAESEEYGSLIQEWEARNLKRLHALITLAQKRGTTISPSPSKVETSFSVG